MKNIIDWSTKHRAGARRAEDIVYRRATPIVSKGSVCIRYTQDQESARRRNQIMLGRLKRENGLIPLFEGKIKR